MLSGYVIGAAIVVVIWLLWEMYQAILADDQHRGL